MSRSGGLSGRGGVAAVVTAIIAAIVVVVAIVVIGGIAGGGSQSLTERATSAADFDYDYEIPAGTAAKIAAGETIEIVPRQLDVHVGETIRIVNDDVSPHNVGLFYVGAGETLVQTFTRAGTLSGTCTVHPSGQFTLEVLP